SPAVGIQVVAGVAWGAVVQIGRRTGDRHAGAVQARADYDVAGRERIVTVDGGGRGRAGGRIRGGAVGADRGAGPDATGRAPRGAALRRVGVADATEGRPVAGLRGRELDHAVAAHRALVGRSRGATRVAVQGGVPHARRTLTTGSLRRAAAVVGHVRRRARVAGLESLVDHAIPAEDYAVR